MATDADARLHDPSQEAIRFLGDALSEFSIRLESRSSVTTAPIGDVMFNAAIGIPRHIEYARTTICDEDTLRLNAFVRS